MEKVAVVWALAGPRREQNMEVKGKPMQHIIKVVNNRQEAQEVIKRIEQRAEELNIQHEGAYGDLSLWIPGQHGIDIYHEVVQVGSMYEAIFS